MRTVVWPRDDRLMAVDALRSDLPDDFWCACLLLLLGEHPGGHRELCERLRRLWLIEADVERIDEALRALAHLGLARAVDGPGGCGHGETYCLTAAGVEQLSHTTAELYSTRDMLDRFLARCAEHIVSHLPVEV